jgi:hypothetical protein
MFGPDLLQRLHHPRRVLLAVCGGGYDVLAAVPLLESLRGRVEMELASLSFSYLNGLQADQDGQVPNLYAVGARATTSFWDVVARIEAAREQMAIRERTGIPI